MSIRYDQYRSTHAHTFPSFRHASRCSKSLTRPATFHLRHFTLWRRKLEIRALGLTPNMLNVSPSTQLFRPFVSSPRPRSARTARLQLEASKQKQSETSSRFGGLGDLLGPIGLTLGNKLFPQAADKSPGDQQERQQYRTAEQTDNGSPSTSQQQSINSMTTEEWESKYAADGCVDLWVEEEFNSGSRLMGGRAAHEGKGWGIGSGEGRSISNAQRHSVKIFNHHANQELEVEVPEDRFILWEAEDQGLLLPYACRMGCCTACAVRVKEGQMSQPEALGISKELKDQGFALMCVGYPKSDLVLETVEEDEIYDMQFGQAFSEQAVDPRNKKFVERDDYALEVANMDE